MTVNYTTLLGLAKPVTGTESGTWGDTVNNNLTDYVDAAVAGTQTISGSLTAVTLSKTTGASLSQAGSGATGSSQYQIILCTGNPASLLTITAPAADKTYIVINATSTSQSVKIVGAGPTTGVTIASGKTTMVAWNGSDFVEITPTTASNLAGGGAGQIPYQSSSGTTAMLAAGTSGQVLTSAGAAPPTWSTPATATKTISNKTANYTVVAGDLGKIINCTSGTFTVSLTAAASLGSGFTCTIWNTSSTSTDAITIDPSGAETIDGVATLVIRRGEGLAIVCDGTNWQTDDKKPMRGYAENFGNVDDRPIASGNRAISMGSAALASGVGAISFGNSASASGNYSLAIGGTGSVSVTTASVSYSSAIGINSAGSGSQAVTGSGAMALGGSYAGGTDSFAAAIGDNTSSYGATGANSVAIGQQTKASGSNAVSIGYNSISSGIRSLSFGTACTASGQYAVAIGYNSLAAQLGKYTFASGYFAAQGDAQFGKIVLRGATTDVTQAALTSDGTGTESTSNTLAVAANQAITFSGLIIGKQSGSANIAAYAFKGAAVNNGSTVTMSSITLDTLINTIGVTQAPTFYASSFPACVSIGSGAKAATNIRWVCNVDSAEVTYA